MCKTWDRIRTGITIESRLRIPIGTGIETSRIRNNNLHDVQMLYKYSSREENSTSTQMVVTNLLSRMIFSDLLTLSALPQ